MQYNKHEIKIASSLTRNPVTLAEALTRHKTTDKEKFDNIFAWVATNIAYNWHQYFSTSGIGKPDINRILKRREGICADYAFLMDTLCKLAGLPSVTLYGYVKDDIFDTGDSLYIDNHAWNAVKIDGLWYLHDVTFSTGYRKYELTRFSQFVVWLRNQLPVKQVTKLLQFPPPAACEGTPDTLTVQFLQFRLKWLWRLTSKVRLKWKFTYESELNTDFYLCNPELFAVTHFPDNPIWALTPQNSMRAFECDSAFYHLEDTLYATQKRSGRSCPPCDNGLGLDELKKQYFERDQSLSFNKRNRFYPATCEYYIGSLNYKKGTQEEDSLAKVTFLDSALAALERSKSNIFMATTGIETDFGLQKSKNRAKYNSLFQDNRAHAGFLTRQASKSYKERMNLQTLELKTGANSRSYRRRIHMISKFETDLTAPEKAVNESLIRQCRQKLGQDSKKLDSLDKAAASARIELENSLPLLAKNVWLQVSHHDTLLKPFRVRLDLRERGLDDYKKKVVEARRKIHLSEQEYETRIDSLVFRPSRSSLEKAQWLFKLNDERFKLQKECYQTLLRLVKLGAAGAHELTRYKEQLHADNKTDYCWLVWRSKYLKLTYKGLKALKVRQLAVRKVIRKENHAESLRYKYVNKELLRRKRRYKSISVNNNHVVKARFAEVKKYKSEYLSSLRKLRRESRQNK